MPSSDVGRLEEATDNETISYNATEWREQQKRKDNGCAQALMENHSLSRCLGVFPFAEVYVFPKTTPCEDLERLEGVVVRNTRSH